MQNILGKIFEEVGSYVPELIGALVILIVGWLIAIIVSSLVRSLLKRTDLDNKLVGWVTGGKALDIEPGIGRGVFWLIMIFVLIAFFQTLGLTLVTDPLNRLVGQLLEYLPQLFGAGILLLLAWVLATIVRLFITKVMGAAKLDERASGQLGSKDEKAIPLTKTIGDVVYWLIFLLFLPAVLGALNLQGLLAHCLGEVTRHFRLAGAWWTPQQHIGTDRLLLDRGSQVVFQQDEFGALRKILPRQ